MGTSELILFDSNVLIYTQDQNFPLYHIATGLIKKIIDGELNGVLAHQNLLEFYSVVTNPRRVTKPIKPQIAASIIGDYLSSSFQIVSPSPDTILIIHELFRYYSPKGGEIYDAYLAATMLSNNIKTIITSNIKDFEIFPDLRVIDLQEAEKLILLQ